MSHYAFEEDNVEVEADYVVVGSGAGGATIAHALAAAGMRVAVVEAGAWRDPEDLPYTTYGCFRDLFHDFGATLVRGRAVWPVVQGRAVGGSTVVNSAICVRTPADIFPLWQAETGFGGDWGDKIWAHQDQLESDLTATPTPDDVATRGDLLTAKGADALGYSHHPTTRFVKDCEGSGQCMQGCRRGRKQSLNLVFMPKVLENGDVLSCAPVDKVLFEGQRAVAVTGRFLHPLTRRKGGTFTARATKGIILAASAVFTPLILMNSGVKNAMVGGGFRAHPGVGMLGVYDEVVDINKGATQGWSSMAFRDDPGLKLETLALTPSLLGGRVKGGGTRLVEALTENFRHLSFVAQGVRAQTVGSVGRVPMLGIPYVNYSLDQPDMIKLRKGIRKIGETFFASGARKIMPLIDGLPFEIGPDQLDLLSEGPLDPRAYTAILSHLFGGACMGTDPKRSVVDAEGKVHGYDALYVADASAFPTNLGVNPQHTIMALARLRADQLLAQQ